MEQGTYFKRGDVIYDEGRSRYHYIHDIDIERNTYHTYTIDTLYKGNVYETGLNLLFVDSINYRYEIITNVKGLKFIEVINILKSIRDGNYKFPSLIDPNEIIYV